MRSFFKSVKRAFRSLLGTEAVLRQLREAERQRRRDALCLGNAIQYAAADQADVRALPEYARVADVARLLQTCRGEGETLVRIGGEIDGG